MFDTVAESPLSSYIVQRPFFSAESGGTLVKNPPAYAEDSETWV